MQIIIIFFLILIGVVALPTVLISWIAHKIINKIYTPSILWVVLNYFIGLAALPVHWMNFFKDTVTTFDQYKSVAFVLVFCVISVLFYVAKRQRIISNENELMYKSKYIDPEEEYYLKSGESNEEAIIRLYDDSKIWLERWLNHMELSLSEIAEIKKSIYSVSSFSKYKPGKLTDMTAHIKTIEEKSYSLAKQIRIRFELILELAEDTDASKLISFDEIRNNYRSIVDGQKKLEETITGIKQAIIQNKHMYNVSETTWSAKEQKQALAYCNDVITIHRRVISCFKFVLDSLYEMDYMVK